MGTVNHGRTLICMAASLECLRKQPQWKGTCNVICLLVFYVFYEICYATCNFSFSFLRDVCMHVCMHVYKYVCTRVHVHLEDRNWSLVSSSITLCFTEMESLTEPKADLASMAASPRNLVSPPKDGIMGKSHTCPAFVWVPRIQTPGDGFRSRSWSTESNLSYVI